MAESTIEVVVRGIGFESLAVEAERVTEAIKAMGNAVRGIGSGSIANGFTRDFGRINNQLRELRDNARITSEYMRGKFSGVGAGLSESLGTNDLIARFRASGEELGKAMRAGVQAGYNAGGPVSPPTVSGGGSRGVGSGGGGSSPPSPSSPFRHVIDPIGGVVAGSVVGHATARAAESIFDQAGALAQTRAQLKAQGISDAEIADVERIARETSDKYRGTTVPQLLQAYGEARTVFPHADEAKNWISTAAPLYQALNGLKGSEHWAKDLDVDQASLDLAKSLELLGVTNDPAKSRHDVDMMLKGISAFKGQIAPSDYNMSFRYARGALRGYDDDFLWTVLPTLAAEFKSRGGQAGPAGNTLQSFYRSAVKNVMTNKQRAAWNGFGLLDENGRTTDLDLARANPLQWWQKDVAPKLKDFDAQKQRDVISQLFPTAIPEQMANIFNFDLPRLRKDAANVRAAAGLDDLNKLFENTPAQAMSEFSAQFKNLLASLGDPAMPAAIGTLKGLAGIFSSITQMMHASPLAGAGIAGGAVAAGGYAAYRILPWLLRSPLGRFGVGAISGGLLGGGLEALLFAGLLGATAPAGGGAGRGIAPGLSRLRGLVGGIAGSRIGSGLIGRVTAATAWVTRIAGVMKPLFGLGSALLLLDGIIGHQNLKDIGSAVWSNFTGDRKGTEAKWKSLDDRFRQWMDGFVGTDNAVWSAIKGRIYPQPRMPFDANLLSKYDLPALGRYERYLGSAEGHVWNFERDRPTWTPRSYGRGGAAFGGQAASSAPVPVVVQSMPKAQPTTVNISVPLTINAATGQSLSAVGGTVGSVVQSKLDNALHDSHSR